MKEVAVYYAKSNQLINEQMHTVIAKSFGEPFTVQLNGYFFKSLGQILDHIFVSDMIWMKAFMEINNFGMNIETEVRTLPSYGERVFTDFDSFLQSRRVLDRFICTYMEQLDPSFFEKPVVRKTSNGLTIEKPSDRAIIHFFNHQTHHRGQISNILDEKNIENNYSNMIFLDL